MEGTGGGGSGGDALDGDDQDDPSSSSSPSPKLDDNNSALDSFRKEWKREIQKSPVKVENTTDVPKKKENSFISIEDEARALFQKGVENEEKGKLYEAIVFYRKAVQLVPDIEFKMPQMNLNNSSDDMLSDKDEEETEATEDELAIDNLEEFPFDPATTDLLTHLLQVMAKHKRALCTPAQPQTGTHISAIPMEVFFYILKWVVSTDLDMGSLERCSLVCRGFYVCCRDTEIWKIACKRVWGHKCGNPVTTDYLNWREMFILRPRVHFTGCYISKTSYIRAGENSFQDQSYRPWHLVTYFRYLRFFPDSTALMLTSPDEPVMSVGFLKRRTPPPRHPPVFTGYYCLHDNMVSLFVSRGPDKRGRLNANQSPIFQLVLEIVNSKKHLHGKLVWKRYSVITTKNGTVNDSHFELTSSTYPPFWFSLVKSYTTEAVNPLV